ncbi:MAG TPA: 2-oxoacid:ferredoxin oxidoreductase subunit gamma [Nitrospirae bacterium]|nr:pyruvate synthase subunit PorC [bacterium BMS3Abin10]GBE38161.1 pyruvate synthase subunit PorC [bacterium BMS3Bbin08]HDH01321.1 2-oxoacid:ferredoxin oxidoreductase subunit gamma [Nitrospirota bacterium]HDK81985.1 2-oxoacid:ferredoxin oxidoreductase subunit gamma [Nitrospirota bacterium]HDO26342.1 2-oxoacid:ferredoxin oxidoreductase subunit gamma [Nitrospirota bacterium]
MKNSPSQLIIAGFGGQGILFAGKLLAQSAMIENRHVTWFPSYGAEIRGGTANCTVIISDEMIGSPVVSSPDSLLIMNQASMYRFETKLKPDGLLVMNTSLVKKPAARPDIKVIGIDATDIAKKLGNAQVANLVMLGALIGRTGIISPKTVIRVLKQITPGHRKNIIPLNESAFKKGFKEIAG